MIIKLKKYLLSYFLFLLVFAANAQCWKDVSAGRRYTLAIKNDGTLWSWGDNSSEQLGDGTNVSKNIPIQVGTATTWQSVCAGNQNHPNAIQTNGTLWGWGDNNSGQQGDGTTNPIVVPTQVGTDTNWKMVDGTWRSTIALKTDGTLWAWGENNVGEFGNGTQIGSLIPIQVGTDTNWKSISAGIYHILALKTDGTLWAWGDNYAGQVGDGTTTMRLFPTQIGTDTDWQNADAYWVHSSARKINGTVWMWGGNSNGALGDGTIITRIIPTLLTTSVGFQNLSLGKNYTMGVKSNGTLWGWGSNLYGELGNSSNLDSHIPVQSGNVSNWQMVNGGLDHSAGIRIDGTLWTWGRNMEGQMGTGNYWTNPGGSNIPMEVLSPNVITASATSTNVCVGSNVVLTANGTATSYTWSGGVVNGAPFVPSATAIYTVTGYDVSGCHNTSTVQILVSPATTVTANATSTLVCLGSGIGTTLTGGGASSYVWSGGVSDGNSFTPSSTETYSVTDASGCSNTATITIQVSSTPTITGVSTQTSCVADAPMVITPSGASTYTLLPNNITGTSFTVYPWLLSNTYTVVGVNTDGCLSTPLTSLQTTITVGTPPQISLSSSVGGNAACYGSTVTLTAMGGASTYTWNGSIVSNSITITATATTMYTLVGTSSTGCLSDTLLYLFGVFELPTIIMNDTLICAGSSAVLAPISSSPVITYSWSTGATTNTIAVSPLVITSYTIYTKNTWCNLSTIVTVSVSPSSSPLTGFSYSSPICSTGNSQLPNTITNFSPNGLFSSSSGLNINSNTGLIDPGLSTLGSHIVTYSVAATNCAPSSISTSTIVINDPLPATTLFLYVSPLCSSGTALPNLVSGFSGGGIYSSGTGLTINSSTGLIDLLNSTPGTYTVNYNVNALNCIQSGAGSSIVTIYPLPLITAGADIKIEPSESVTLNAISSTGTYTWYPPSNLSCTICPDPSVTGLTETVTYCVKTTDGVCTNSACVTVNVELPCADDKSLYLPNAFSPNGNGNNDVFCVQGETKCVTDFKMLIFDRWGEKIFESTDITFCWDGTYKSKALNPDVFVYYITAINKDQEKITKKGNVTLIK